MGGRAFRIPTLGLLIASAACGDDSGTATETDSAEGSSSGTSPTSSPTSADTTMTTEASASESTSADSTSGDPTSVDTTAASSETTDGTAETTVADGGSSSAGTSDDTTTGGMVMVDCPPAADDATITGTVFAPNGVIPVSGALVYTSQDIPAGIPQGVYCAECEELQCDDVATLTGIDGTFTLDTNAAQANYLVVQKGQFMVVTPLALAPGANPIDDAFTTLPNNNDPANGRYIPLIAVGDGTYDRLEDALGKFGLGDTMIANFEERLVPGTESFDLWDNGRDPTTDGFISQGTFDELVSDPNLLAQYHVIFVPCSTDDFVDSLTPANVANIRDWVAAGGRWYVADWANEWMGQVFPEYQEFEGGNLGGGDLGSYDSLADVLDDDMLDWLEALPAVLGDINPLNDEPHPTLGDLPQLQTVDNWSAIIATPPVLVDDGEGGQLDIGHKVWLQGDGLGLGVHPLTVTGQHGCGKIQFTSYHTAEFFDYVGLSPQELVLIYTILEIGVCQQSYPM